MKKVNDLKITTNSESGILLRVDIFRNREKEIVRYNMYIHMYSILILFLYIYILD